MWNVTANILLASMWKLYMQSYSQAIYGTVYDRRSEAIKEEE